MKIALVSLVLVVVILLSVACFRRSSRMPKSSSFVVTLPEGWYEVPGELPREYRRKAEGSGVLQISLQPPVEHSITTGDDAKKELAILLESIKMDLGQRLVLMHEQATHGIMATALSKSDKQGLLQFWLIPTEVTIFASYTMGALDTVKEEIAEAAQIIIKTIRLE